MAVATCVNAQCPEHGIPKTIEIELREGEVIRCGGMTEDGPCFEPCEVTPDAETKPA